VIASEAGATPTQWNELSITRKVIRFDGLQRNDQVFSGMDSEMATPTNELCADRID
jgi:hypothetical protein